MARRRVTDNSTYIYQACFTRQELYQVLPKLLLIPTATSQGRGGITPTVHTRLKDAGQGLTPNKWKERFPTGLTPKLTSSHLLRSTPISHPGC